MSGGDGDQDDGILGTQGADAMDDTDGVNWPAAGGFRGDNLEGLFGHSRIMFQGQAVDLGTLVDVAHEPDEADEGANLGVPQPEGGLFRDEVKGFRLNPDVAKHGWVSAQAGCSAGTGGSPASVVAASSEGLTGAKPKPHTWGVRFSSAVRGYLRQLGGRNL